MKKFISSPDCRRKMLLEYFGEEVKDPTCSGCDNCCGAKSKVIPKLTTRQEVKNEAKMLIDLIESIPFPSYGKKMYVNILRGSKNKSIGKNLTKNKFYEKGNHKSVAWWEELCEHLIKLGYLRQDYIKGKFMSQVIKVTHKGVMWTSTADLEDFGAEKLEPVEMTVEN
jgi:ATP-dependent DNA helicase RecQ